jgi:hypothetical protein
MLWYVVLSQAAECHDQVAVVNEEKEALLAETRYITSIIYITYTCCI